MNAWPPKDWRALLALVFSVIGAVVLTLFVWWGYYQLMPDPENGWSVSTEMHRAGTARWVLWVAIGAVAVVLVGLGMAVNRRSFKGQIGQASVDFQGGDEAAAIAADAVQRQFPGEETKP